MARLHHAGKHLRCGIHRPQHEPILGGKICSNDSHELYHIHSSILTFSSLQNFMNSETHKFLCCLCCQSGPLVCRLHIPKSGFVGGEAIIPQVEVNNQSSSNVAMVSLELKRKAAFTGERYRRVKVCYETTTGTGFAFESVGKKQVSVSGGL